ncbi:hypothetical protein [Candidatus Phycosocius spiralis]|nr:hypothetical protein [Candidatus Phycosocius spiralis]
MKPMDDLDKLGPSFRMVHSLRNAPYGAERIAAIKQLRALHVA